MDAHSLIISFPDQSQSFTLGVEYGRLLQKIEQGDQSIENCGFPVHIDNIEVLKNTCNAYGYIALFGRRYYSEWVEFTAIKKVSNGCN